MSGSFMHDFNGAEPQQNAFELIPAGTLVKVRLTIRPGGIGPEGWVTQSRTSEAQYLNTEAVILDGPHARRRIYTRIGLRGKGGQGDDTYANRGRSLIRGILESARGVAAVSPWLRPRRTRLADEQRLLSVADLTTRHVRAIARRVDVLVRDGHARPLLAELVESAAEVVRLLGRSRDDEAARSAARGVATVLAGQCSPTAVDGVADQVVIVLLRPLVFDILVHLGTPPVEARALLPPL